MSRLIIRKNILIFAFALSIIFSFTVFMLYKFVANKPISTLNSVDKKILDIDLDGDGKKDALILDVIKDDFVIKIQSNSKEFILTPNDKNNFGNSISNSISINVCDLSRDSIPEIIVSTYSNTSNSNYIFKYINSTFKNILTTEDNTICILNSQNTQSPFFISISSSNSDENSRAFIIKKDTVKDISFGKIKIPGYSIYQNIIDSIEKPYEVLEMPDIFSSELPSNELSFLWTLQKDSFAYSFKQGFIKDINWDSNNSPISIEYILRFDVAKKIGDSNDDLKLTLLVKIDKNQYGEFKVSSIQKI